FRSRLRAGRRARERGTGAAYGRGPRHAQRRSPHPALVAFRRAGLQSVPALRAAAGGRGRRTPRRHRAGRTGGDLCRPAGLEGRVPRMRLRPCGRRARGVLLGLALAVSGVPVAAAETADPAVDPPSAAIDTRSGLAIYASFREGLADPSCPAGASERWQAHFAKAPEQLAASPDESLALFGYVVDAVRAAHLPTEY